MQGSSLMVAALVDPEWPKRWSRQGEQAPIVLGVAVLTLGILSVVPGSRATEPLDGDANGNATGEPFAADKGLPFLTTENFSFGAVTESSAQAAEADKLAKQLANPISSLISVPFQANEDFGYGPSHNGYKFTLNIQPVIPISISKDWNLILRTIFPIVSQHDLFYVGWDPGSLALDRWLLRRDKNLEPQAALSCAPIRSFRGLARGCGSISSNTITIRKFG